MIKFADFTPEEDQIVFAITARAEVLGLTNDRLSTEMDISATHAQHPLRLADLLAADNTDFVHDIAGIARHMDRRTGKLKNYFLPRFARPDSAA